METTLYFLMIFGFYFVTVAAVLVGVYSPAKIQLITFPKYVEDVFKTSGCLVKNNNHFKNYFWTIIFSCLNIVAFAFFMWLWLSTWNNALYVIGFISLFLLSWVFISLITNNLIKKLKKFKSLSWSESISCFDNLSQKYDSQNLNTINFQILKDEKLAPRNRPFQFHQKRCMKKIQKIFEQEMSTRKRKEKLVLLFDKYLKNYAIFIKSMIKEIGQYSYVIDNKKQSFEQLPDTLVHNFFAMVQENYHKYFLKI